MEHPFNKWSFFGVYDGHNGHYTAINCSKYLLQTILKTPEFQTMKFDDFGNPKQISQMRMGIRRGFLQFDEFLRSLPDVFTGVDRSGSTATCVFITPRYFVFVNCGDSRGMLIRENSVNFSTTDHKPQHTDETLRIENAGGTVFNERVNGCLGVSRSLGDFVYKKATNKQPFEQMVSPDPTVTVIERNELDNMIVLACDGIWDVNTNEYLCKYLCSRVCRVGQISKIAEEVIDLSFFKGSKDNMSIIIIYLKPTLNLDLDMALEDAVLDRVIHEKTEEYFKENPNVTSTAMWKWFYTIDLPNLPPGGLVTKRYQIEKSFEELKSLSVTSLKETPFILRCRNLAKI